MIHKYLQPNQRIFGGVIAPIDQHIETTEEVRDVRSNPARIGAGARETVNS